MSTFERPSTYGETGRWRGDLLADGMTASGRDYPFATRADSCR
jgi:hypothetical protein